MPGLILDRTLTGDGSRHIQTPQVLVEECPRVGSKTYTVLSEHCVQGDICRLSVHYPNANSIPEEILAHPRLPFSQKAHSSLQETLVHDNKVAHSIAHQWLAPSVRSNKGMAYDVLTTQYISLRVVRDRSPGSALANDLFRVLSEKRASCML
jgi:hypothetical protein